MFLKSLIMDQQGFSHVFADFINNILVKKLNPLPIIGDGNQIRCFTWIEDVAEIISLYSIDDRTINQTFNICNVEPISMRQLAEKIFRAQNNTQELKFQTIKDYNYDVLVRIPSVDKLSKLIGEYQYVKIDQSIQQCLEEVNGNS